MDDILKDFEALCPYFEEYTVAEICEYSKTTVVEAVPPKLALQCSRFYDICSKQAPEAPRAPAEDVYLLFRGRLKKADGQ